MGFTTTEGRASFGPEAAFNGEWADCDADESRFA